MTETSKKTVRLVGATNARIGFFELLRRACGSNRVFVVTMNGIPAAQISAIDPETQAVLDNRRNSSND